MTILGLNAYHADSSACLIKDGRVRHTTEGRIAGHPTRIPQVDIVTVGAGGGSIASVKVGGVLRVGPQSAGANPGPACYGISEEATVTDANVVLNRLDANKPLSGEIALHPLDQREVGEVRGGLERHQPLQDRNRPRGDFLGGHRPALYTVRGG